MSTPQSSSAAPPGSSCGPGRPRHFTAEQKARAVAYATIHGCFVTAQKYGVTRRTIERWRSQADPKTTARAVELTRVAGDRWAEEVLSASVAVVLAGAERKLEQLQQQGAELTPKELHAWAGAMKLANDARTTAELLEQRKRPPRPAPPQKPAAPNVVQLQPVAREAV